MVRKNLITAFRSLVCLSLVLLGVSQSVLAAPTVPVFSPAANSTWINEFSPVVGHFSEAMKPSTITVDGFTLEKKVGVVAVAAGASHMVALKGNGTVVAWGDNYYGQTDVPEGLVGVVAIAAGKYHTVALKGDGTVVAWGNNDGSSNDHGQTDVPAGLSGVVAIAASGWHTVALKSDGTVVAWGKLKSADFSYNNEVVPAGLSGVVAIAATEDCTYALKEDGTVVTWGYGNPVPLGLSGVVAIAAGGTWRSKHAVALKGDGTVYSWDGWSGINTAPVGLSGVVGVAAGLGHTVAVKSDGTVVAWGQVGSQPVTVPADLGGVAAVAAGDACTVALKGDGTMSIWGIDSGQITIPMSLSGVVAISTTSPDSHNLVLKGDGTVASWPYEIYQPPAGLTGVTAIATGDGHNLALKSNGTVVAWGSDYHNATYVPAGLSGVVAIAARDHLSIAVKGDGSLVSWGDTIPTVPLGLTGVKAVAIGGSETMGYHVLALKTNGDVVAWGSNLDGEATVPPGLGGVVAIAAGSSPYAHSVALKSDGTVVSWGANAYGQTGLQPAGLSGVIAISAGGGHTLALKGDGTVVAWGNNNYGQATVPPGLSDVVAIAAGRTGSWAVKGDGTLVTWGGNQSNDGSRIPKTPWFAPVATTVAYNGTNGTATLTPSAPLALNTSYRATLWGRSASGVPMAGSLIWDFSTGESLTSFLVTPTKGLHGKISPAIGRLIPNGTTASFTITPDTNYLIDSVTGCGGSLVGTTYTTGPISQACTVKASFRWAPMASTPASLTVPANDADGIYTVSWTASTTAGVTYVLQEATNSTFTTGLRQAYSGTALSAAITGRTQNTTYYYRVQARKSGYSNSAWRGTGNGCLVKAPLCAAPASLTVPSSSGTGAYTVKWDASTTAGVSYQLQEATNNSFTTGLRAVYTGTALSANITGRSQNTTYYYRVRATRTGYTASGYRAAANGCAVPGTMAVGVPASLTVPLGDTDGVYTVSWGASATAGVTYELQEATNSVFTSGLRAAYRGTALSTNITGRSQNVTYYYRVRAVKAGLRDSGYRVGVKGCAIPGNMTAGAPIYLSEPDSDLDGAYTVSWGASSTPGVTYELQEATNTLFSVGLRTAYRGTALSTNITGRSQNVTYYYRVRAVKAGVRDSVYYYNFNLINGCAVPGTSKVSAPSNVTHPSADLDGVYKVSWTASATAGVLYELQESTSLDFTVGTRIAYLGSSTSFNITGRVAGKKYYYRVLARKGGLVQSNFYVNPIGCLVGP